MQQTKFLVTERQSNVPCSEAAFGDFQRGLAYPDRFGDVIGRAQSIKLVVEDSPKVLLAFHGNHQPSLNWVTRWVASSSAAKGKACRSSVVTSVPTKKLVVPTTSALGMSKVP